MSRVVKGVGGEEMQGLVRLRYKTVLLIVAGVLCSGMIQPAMGHEWQPDGSGGAADYGGEPVLADEVSVATMTDTLTQALLGPCENDQEGCDSSTPTRQCTRLPLDNRTNGPIPGNANQWQAIYFVPSDGTVQNWSQPVGCNDGQRAESNIGFGLHNTRAWMASRPATGNAARIRGQSFRILTRAYSAYGRTWTFYDVMHIRGPHNTTFYRTDTFNRMIIDLNNMGWQHPNVKYSIWADVIGDVAGRGEFNGNQGAVHRRMVINGATRGMRWGCADFGDTAMMQEALHMWGIVNPAWTDHDPTPGRQNHVIQPQDVMFWRGDSSLSGFNDAGGPALAGQSVWDAGAQTYTDRVLAFPAYLTPTATNWVLHRC